VGQRVIEAFGRCRQKIHAIRQRGVGDSLCQALDGALRSTAPSLTATYSHATAMDTA